MTNALSRLTICFLICSGVNLTSASAQDPDSSAAADSLLLRLQREMAAMPPATQPRTQDASASRSRQSTNPDISVIGDVRARYFSEGTRNFDLELHEVETALRAAVDPYARADVYIAAANEDGEIHFELEEAFLTTLALPHQLQLKAGKFRSNIGKLNRLHPHALPFPDIPTVYENYFGAEGLNDQGIGISWLVPNSSFYQELSLEVTGGAGESASFEASEENRLLYSGHLKNFWDITDNATLELGLSGLAGPNNTSHTSWIGGVDVTYKWKPVRFNRYRSFTLQAEAFFSRKKTGGDDLTTWGMYALANYQLSQRWFLVGRFDHSDLPDDGSWNDSGITTTLAWYATEFQKIEFGARTTWREGEDQTYQAIIRAIFVMGTHGAHEY